MEEKIVVGIVTKSSKVLMVNRATVEDDWVDFDKI
tara:strand:- start:212 stop:316 length:105 start_codon:yes stop_codon:yes gene_type:complete